MNALELCNGCEIDKADPASPGGYCTACENAARHETHGGDERPDYDECPVCRAYFDEAARLYSPGRATLYNRAEIDEGFRLKRDLLAVRD